MGMNHLKIIILEHSFLSSGQMIFVLNG